jgi:hypothetical protein
MPIWVQTGDAKRAVQVGSQSEFALNPVRTMNDSPDDNDAMELLRQADPVDHQRLALPQDSPIAQAIFENHRHPPQYGR